MRKREVVRLDDFNGERDRFVGLATVPRLQRAVCGEMKMENVFVRDPEILGGRPVFRGTRVPVEVLFENLEDGLSIDEIVVSYPSLSKDDLIACLEAACADLKAAAE